MTSPSPSHLSSPSDSILPPTSSDVSASATRTNTPVAIRQFRPGDEDAVIALWEACGLTRPWNDPRQDIARKLTMQPDLFLVVESNTTIIATAMAGYDGHRGWINYLGVDPAHQRLGMARMLMAEIEARLAALGCPKVNLQVRAGNAAAVGFYGALGYAQDDVVCFGRRLIEDLTATRL